MVTAPQKGSGLNAVMAEACSAAAGNALTDSLSSMATALRRLEVYRLLMSDE